MFSVTYFVIIGFVGGGILASTGMIGPFLMPSLLLLGLPSGIARGTCIVSELLVAIFSVLAYRRSIDGKVVLAFLPGALAVFLGANASWVFAEAVMRKLIGIFEMIVGAVVMADLRWSKREYHRTISGNSKLILLMLVSVLAGFAKGFFGAGWGR